MKTLIESRNELAKQQGDNHTHPELRSMYPQTSRGDMSRQFAHLYTLGFDAGANAVMEYAKKLVEALEKCGVSHTPLCTSVGCYKNCVELKRESALKEWQEFIMNQSKEPK